MRSRKDNNEAKIEKLRAHVAELDKKIAEGHYDAPWLKREREDILNDIAWI